MEERFEGGGRGGLLVVDGGASEGPAEVVEGGADMMGVVGREGLRREISPWKILRDDAGVENQNFWLFSSDGMLCKVLRTMRIVLWGR